MLFKIAQKSPNILDNLVRKFVAKNFQKLPNLVTLLLTGDAKYFCAEISAETIFGAKMNSAEFRWLRWFKKQNFLGRFHSGKRPQMQSLKYR